MLYCSMQYSTTGYHMWSKWLCALAYNLAMGPVIPYSPRDRMTDICENITFPQLLLRAVKIMQSQIRAELQFPSQPL